MRKEPLSTEYIAGVFDADGCCAIRNKPNHKQIILSQVTLYWYNDSLELLEAIASSLEVPNIPRPRTKPKGGTSYTLSVGNRKHVKPLVEKFLEAGCIVKRERLLRAKELLSRPAHIRDDLWTEDEDSIVRNTTDKSVEEVAQMLGFRTIAAVEYRRRKLELTKSRDDLWTEDEDAIIGSTLDKPLKEVAKMFEKRTACAIQHRQFKLGLRRPKRLQRSTC